jgi:hypothetical protein
MRQRTLLQGHPRVSQPRSRPPPPRLRRRRTALATELSTILLRVPPCRCETLRRNARHNALRTVHNTTRCIATQRARTRTCPHSFTPPCRSSARSLRPAPTPHTLTTHPTLPPTNCRQTFDLVQRHSRVCKQRLSCALPPANPPRASSLAIRKRPHTHRQTLRPRARLTRLRTRRHWHQQRRRRPRQQEHRQVHRPRRALEYQTHPLASCLQMIVISTLTFA